MAVKPRTNGKTDDRNPFAEGQPTANKLLESMVSTYLAAVDEIRQHNATYLVDAPADRDAPTPNKLLGKAKEEGRDEDVEDSELDKLLTAYQNAWDAVSSTKLAVAKYYAAKHGIELAPEAPKADESEVDALKEQRKAAVKVAKLLNDITENLDDKTTTSTLETFLTDYSLPEVGRKAEWSATDKSVGTPKYRVQVKAVRNGESLLDDKEGSGFAKAAQYIAKHHEKRADAPTANDFRAAWEAKGNQPGETKQATVEFEREGIVYTMTAK